MKMRYCENIFCDNAGEPIERISDYRIVDGAVVCTFCYELQEEEEGIIVTSVSYSQDLRR